MTIDRRVRAAERCLRCVYREGVGWAARRGPISLWVGMGLFRAASLRTRCAPFRCAGLSSDLCRVRDGVRVDVVMACRADDQGLAPHLCHEGCPRGLAWPGSAELVECGDLVDGHRGAVLAQLAPPLAEPGDQLLAGVAGPGRGGVVDDRAPALPEGDPAEPCYQVLLACSLQPGLEAGPGAVAGDSFRLVAGGCLGHGGLVLGGEGLQH